MEDKSPEVVKSKIKESKKYKEKDNRMKDSCNGSEVVSGQKDNTKPGHGITHQDLDDDKTSSLGSKKHSPMSSRSEMSPV